MNVNLRRFGGLALVLIAILLLMSCDVETNKERADYAKLRTQMKRILVSLESNRNKDGSLPSALVELEKKDVELRDIDTTRYAYSPVGFLVPNGTRWLISVPDPWHQGHLIVGRLPIEITSLGNHQ
jgi:hypothetical protein